MKGDETNILTAIFGLGDAIGRKDAAVVAARLNVAEDDARLLMQDPGDDTDEGTFLKAYLRIERRLEEQGHTLASALRTCNLLAGVSRPTGLETERALQMTTLVVLVPNDATAARDTIDPGSGIVALDDERDTAVVYFEGNRFGASNLTTFAQKVTHAADRLVTRYPTVACGLFKRADFTVVGTVVCEPGQPPRLMLTNVTLAQEWDALPKRRL